MQKKSDIIADRFDGMEGPLDSQHLLVLALLPPAVQAFLADCESEVNQLCGDRYQHGKVNHRWGSQNGSIIMANQHVALEIPRVRGKDGKEVRLQTYQDFQNPKLFERAVFTEGLKKVSQRDYEKGVLKIANSFGIKRSSVSQKWVKATAKKIEELSAFAAPSIIGATLRLPFEMRPTKPEGCFGRYEMRDTKVFLPYGSDSEH